MTKTSSTSTTIPRFSATGKLSSAQLIRQKHTAAWEALRLCLKFFPWRACLRRYPRQTCFRFYPKHKS